MTDQQKKEWGKQLISGIVTILATLILYSFTIGRENKITVTNKIQKLETEKANITYVDDKCKQVKEDNNSQFNELKNDIREIRDVQNKMYEILLNNK
jgi:hypothetical protein